MAVATGTLIDDKFEILSLRGTGAFGAVYEAKQRGFDRAVALKLLLDRDEETVARFMREAKILALLRNRHLPIVYGYGLYDGRPYMALEWLNGKTLMEVLRQSRRLSSAKTLQVFQQLCEGLRCAHENDILHRDLKPANVLLQSTSENEDVLKLLDFGLAKELTPSSQQLTQEGSAVGTVQYMAPEVCQGGKVTKASDVYALGCMMYHCLTGSPPFDADTAVAIMMMHVNQSAPELVPENTEDSESSIKQWHDLVERCISKNSELRLQSCDEVLDELKTIEQAIREHDGGVEKFAKADRKVEKNLSQHIPQSTQKPKAPYTQRWIYTIVGISILTALALFLINTMFLKPTAPVSNTNPVAQAQTRALGDRLFEKEAEAQMLRIANLQQAGKKDEAILLQKKLVGLFVETGRVGYLNHLLQTEELLRMLVAEGRWQDCAQIGLELRTCPLLRQKVAIPQQQAFMRIRAVQSAVEGNERQCKSFFLEGLNSCRSPAERLHFLARLPIWQRREQPSSLRLLAEQAMLLEMDYYQMMTEQEREPFDKVTFGQACNYWFWKRFAAMHVRDDKTKKLCRDAISVLDKEKQRLLYWQLETMYAKMLAEEGQLKLAEEDLDSIKVPADSCTTEYEITGFMQARLTLARAYKFSGKQAMADTQVQKLMKLVDEQPRLPAPEKIKEGWIGLYNMPKGREV